MADHVHEVEVVVHGVVVHRHGISFVGVPGDVTVRHRSRPVEVRQVMPHEQPEQFAMWTDIDPDDWPWGTE